MSKTLPPLCERLRDAARKLRTSSISLSDFIPLLQQAADAIEAQGVPDVDALAQFIREIDGANRFGAGALAEHICGWLASAPPAPQAKQPLTDEQRQALINARNLAMQQIALAPIPECAHFGNIAQSLDWLCDQFGVFSTGIKGE